MVVLKDTYNRQIKYLRISLTDRCNLRCWYCMPAGGVTQQTHGDILRYEEILRLAAIAAELGVVKVRLTGGEPLVRMGVVDLVRRLVDIEGIADLALSTNGMLLDQFAAPLVQAGLKRVNVSLDSLKPETFAHITRVGDLEQVLRGVEQAQAAGLAPIKINMVALRGVNDGEILDFLRWGAGEGFEIRFIEFMPVGGESPWSSEYYLSAGDILEIIEQAYAVEPVESFSLGPARLYRVSELGSVVGLISPLSHSFCSLCNRLRLTADGKLRACLLDDTEHDVKALIRGGAGDEEIAEFLLAAVRSKPDRHHLQEGVRPAGRPTRSMYHIGG